MTTWGTAGLDETRARARRRFARSDVLVVVGIGVVVAVGVGLLLAPSTSAEQRRTGAAATTIAASMNSAASARGTTVAQLDSLPAEQLEVDGYHVVPHPGGDWQVLPDRGADPDAVVCVISTAVASTGTAARVTSCTTRDGRPTGFSPPVVVGF